MRSWKPWARDLNRYLVLLERLLWPSVIVIGGGVSADFERYGRHLDTRTPVVPAQFHNDAGVIGAAMSAGPQAAPWRRPAAESSAHR